MNYQSRQIIISPLVYLMEERRRSQSWTTCTTPRMIVAGWILGLLPRELHEEARKRILDPLFKEIDEFLRQGRSTSEFTALAKKRGV